MFVTSRSSLRLELSPTGDDTWLYAGASATAFLTGGGTASGLLDGQVRWSGRATRTDRWEVEIEGTIQPADGELVAFTTSGFLVEAAGTQPFLGGMSFRTADTGYAALNLLFATVTGSYDSSSGLLSLNAIVVETALPSSTTRS
jgi:hypothetical protein